MEIVKLFLSKGYIDLAITLSIIAVFVWVIALCFVYVIKKTRAKKVFGSEYDPEKTIDRRKK